MPEGHLNSAIALAAPLPGSAVRENATSTPIGVGACLACLSHWEGTHDISMGRFWARGRDTVSPRRATTSLCQTRDEMRRGFQ